MNRILIIGADTVPGQAIFHALSGSYNITGLTLKSPHVPGLVSVSRVTKSRLKTELNSSDVTVFCGSAALSSWDTDFGSFPAEDQWLNQCLESALERASRIIYISSDAVYGGPWMFHDDESDHLCKSAVARKIRSIEQTVAQVPDSLIVRTNVIGFRSTANSYYSSVLNALQNNRTVKLNATASSTPIAAAAFGQRLGCLLRNGSTGYVNIGGAERTTAYHFATLLAAVRGDDTNLIAPVVESQPHERSMRCDRLCKAIGLTPPMLRETIEALEFNEYELEFAAA